MGCADSKPKSAPIARGGAGGHDASLPSSIVVDQPEGEGHQAGSEGWSETFDWADSAGEKRTVTASTLPGWRWGMLVTGVPHPNEWSESLWNVLERLIVSNGLLALEDDVVCTAEAEQRMAAAGVGPRVDMGAIATGDNDAFLNALNATLTRLVAMENLFLAEPADAAAAAAPTGEARGIDRSLTVRQARMFARSEHDYMVTVCRAAAQAAQNMVVQGRAEEAVRRVLAAIIDTGAVNLQFTNMRYHIAKYFGYVLPTEALVDWMCTQYEGCKRVISVGSGTSFLELALQVAANKRFGDAAFEVVCVENNIELLGLGEEEIETGRDLAEHKPRGFRVDPTSVQLTLPKFQAGDAVLICWGRSPEVYEQKGNVWTDAEAMAVNTPGVDTCVTIGACDWQYFRPDRWAGHVLQAPGLPPFDALHDRAGESGLPYGWWWSVTGAVPLPGKDDDPAKPLAATWHGVFGNCMTLYKNVSNRVVSWKRLESPRHYPPPAAATVVAVPVEGGGGGATAAGGTHPQVVESKAIAADTPMFVEYPAMGTRCRVMTQSGVGLTLGNVFALVQHNPALKAALAVPEEGAAPSAQGADTGLPMSALRLSLTPDGTNQECVPHEH